MLWRLRLKVRNIYPTLTLMSISKLSLRITALALRIHSRLIHSGNHFAVKEGFVNLLETLSSWYQDSSLSSRLPSCGMSSESPVHMGCLNIVNLILNMATSITKSWIRFPPSYIDEIILKMVQLISIKAPNNYSPIQLFSIVDLDANWLKDWLHPKVQRTIFFKHLIKEQVLLQRLPEVIQNFIESTTFEQYKEMKEEIETAKTRPKLLLMGNGVIQFGSFLHQVSLLSRLTFFKQGRQAFGNIQEVVNSLVNLATLTQTAAFPGQIIVDKFPHLMTKENSMIVADRLQESNRDVLINCIVLLSNQKILEHNNQVIIERIVQHKKLIKSDNRMKQLIQKIFFGESGIFQASLSNTWREIINEFEDPTLCQNLQFSTKVLLLNPNMIKVSRKLNPSLLSRYPVVSIQDKIVELFRKTLSPFLTEEPIDNFGDDGESVFQELLMTISSYTFFKHFTVTNYFQDILTSPEDSIVKLRLILGFSFNLDCLLMAQKNDIFKCLTSQLYTEEECILDEELLYLKYIQNLNKGILGGPSEHSRSGFHLNENLKNSTTRKQVKGSNSVQSACQPLNDFLQENTNFRDLGWLESLGDLVRQLLVTNNVYLETEKIVKIINNVTTIYIPTKGAETRINTEEKYDLVLGNKMILGYGEEIGILNDVVEPGQLLRNLHSKVCQEIEGCYDWFVGCVFLMTGGDYNSSLSFLKSLTSGSCFVTPFLWPHMSARQHSASFQLSSVGFCVELIMELELPLMTSLLKTEKVPVGVILDVWLRQTFLNILDFKDIEHFILFSLLYGADYIVYFCLSVLRHLQGNLVDQESQSNINLFQRIMTQSIDGFNSGDYLPFMDKLATRYKTMILSYFQECLNRQ